MLNILSLFSLQAVFPFVVHFSLPQMLYDVLWQVPLNLLRRVMYRVCHMSQIETQPLLEVQLLLMEIHHYS